MSTTFHHTALLALGLACASILMAAEAEKNASWPQFHGPKRDNISTETGLLKQWPAGGPKLLWKSSDCGWGMALISIANNTIFTTGDFDDQEMVIALDLDGKLKWKTPNGKSWTGAQPGSRTTPTYDDGLVYHLGPHGNLTAFDAASGKVVWTVDIKERFSAGHGMWGYTENLLVDGDKVLCMPGGADGRVVALDKKTGKTIWANTEITDRSGYSSPIVATYQGVRQFITLARTTVLGVDIATGKLLWSAPHKGFCDQNVTSPIFHDGRIFVTSGHRAGARVVKIGGGDQGASELWYEPHFDNCHGGVVLLDGYLYGCGCRLYNKGLFCVAFDSGKVQYRAEAIGKVSITYADGLLYCLNNEGEMLLIKATPESATILSRFPVPHEGKEFALTHPVICGGRLYLRYYHDLFAYDIRATP